jgi:hypothetical protein
VLSPAVGRLTAASLFGVSSASLPAAAMAVALMAGGGVVAVLLATWRITKVDPARLLRLD